jgi:cytochrome c biogenesis protein CcmG/thiol:disulfide interchange protein DsbE
MGLMVAKMIRILRLSLALFALVMAGSSPGWSVEVGESMPQFSLKTFDGATFSRATLTGKPLLLIFWNTWCPKCMKELPEVRRLAEEDSPRGLVVLAVNTAMNDNEGKARAHWEKQGYAFPGAFDRHFEIGQAFGVFGVPTVFVFDREGNVLYKQATLPDDIEERLTKLTSKG